jgi:hypothetical protein
MLRDQRRERRLVAGAERSDQPLVGAFEHVLGQYSQPVAVSVIV